MKNIELHQVDAFTDELFGGNPAGVVTNADGLEADEMQQIAREMNLSETAFVLEPTEPEATLRLRYFTPSQEVAFCGHATVGALAQLALLNRYGLHKPGNNEITVQTQAENLRMSVVNEHGKIEIGFTAPALDLQSYPLQGASFAEKMGINDSMLLPGSTIMIDKNLRYIYIPARSLAALGEQNFDFARIKQQFADENIIVFCLFSSETMRPESDLHARGLAPLVGIDEDPFTGSMQAGLLAAAKHNNLIPADQTVVVSEQGHFIERPGFAILNHDLTTDRITVRGQATPFFSTTIQLPS